MLIFKQSQYFLKSLKDVPPKQLCNKSFGTYRMQELYKWLMLVLDPQSIDYLLNIPDRFSFAYCLIINMLCLIILMMQIFQNKTFWMILIMLMSHIYFYSFLFFVIQKNGVGKDTSLLIGAIFLTERPTIKKTIVEACVQSIFSAFSLQESLIFNPY